MRIIFILLTFTVWLFAEENTALEYDIFFYGQLLTIALLLGYIFISKLRIFGKCKKENDKGAIASAKKNTQTVTTASVNEERKRKTKVLKANSSKGVKSIKTFALKHNKDVIDIDKGLKEAKSHARYQDILLDAMDKLNDTIEPFSNMVYNEEYRALGEFSELALELYEKIHATEMIKMFKELNEYIATKQRTYLMEYVFLYRKNWKKLQIEIERYMEYTQT